MLNYGVNLLGKNTNIIRTDPFIWREVSPPVQVEFSLFFGRAYFFLVPGIDTNVMGGWDSSRVREESVLRTPVDPVFTAQ